MGISQKRRVKQALVLASFISIGAFSLPRLAVADDLYTGADSTTANTPYIDGGDFFNADNWNNGVTNPPTNTVPSGSLTANIDADTGFTVYADPQLVVDGSEVGDAMLNGTSPGQGAVFGGSIANPSPSLSLSGKLYISSISAATSAGVMPNQLTMAAGTFELTNSTSGIIGRDATGEILQTGGSFYADDVLEVGAANTNVGDGIINFSGGKFVAGISSSGTAYTGSSAGLRLGQNSGSVGIVLVHNNATPGSQFLADNYYSGYVSGGLGITDFYYENGGVTTINVTGGNEAPPTGTQGQLAIRNWAATPTFGTGTDGAGGTIGSVLNLTLNAAPTVIGGDVQNLALFTYVDGIHAAASGDDADFFLGNGTDLTEGSTISATYDGQTYDWKIYYDGSVSSVSGQITSAISQTGGEDGLGSESAGTGAVVLIGQPFTAAVPEPATLSLLGLVGGYGLLRRRRSV